MAIMNIKAEISASDSLENVIMAIRELFPNAIIPNKQDKLEFPILEKKENIEIYDIDYKYFFERIHEIRIADTALDCMSQNIENNSTSFKVSRQAALAGKISFVLENDNPLGGVFEIEIKSENITAWIEEVTWHRGREEVPREIDDELKMRNDGVPQEWF
ncbi:MAG: hypothetical protein CMB64_00230 [Euryarchaeota archaeon]|nr:hypothetical protein [Euryarchaeota archaeon]|tara:strand:- start:301 stop:780 length:480 start_codon:yes stop_codon:yes gene_type:complete